MARVSGVLMPITSLPSPYGIGTIGKEARKFADFLKASGQSIWQILPVGPTSYGDSPYQSFSTYAGNPYMIDLDYLVEEGLLTEAQINGFPDSKTAEEFDKDENRILVVANKYITGFDQPKLAAMYIDKPLDGVLAVQALSRLNRSAPELGKLSEDLFIIDPPEKAVDLVFCQKTLFDKRIKIDHVRVARVG